MKVILEQLDGIQNGGKLRIQVNWKLEITKLVIQCRGKKKKKEKKIMDSKWKKSSEKKRERNRVARKMK